MSGVPLGLSSNISRVQLRSNSVECSIIDNDIESDAQTMPEKYESEFKMEAMESFEAKNLQDGSADKKVSKRPRTDLPRSVRNMHRKSKFRVDGRCRDSASAAVPDRPRKTRYQLAREKEKKRAGLPVREGREKEKKRAGVPVREGREARTSNWVKEIKRKQRQEVGKVASVVATSERFIKKKEPQTTPCDDKTVSPLKSAPFTESVDQLDAPKTEISAF
eukprot:766080_1